MSNFVNATHKDGAAPHNRAKKRSIDFIIENEEKSDEKTSGVQRWLNEPEIMRKLHNDPNFSSIANHCRLKKEMTEAASQMKNFDWICSQYDAQLTETQGDQYLIMDICAGKGFFGVLVSHILRNAQIVLLDKNKKMNMKHLQSCPNIAFRAMDIRAHKFSLSAFIREQYYKHGKQRLVLVGCHLCGELSETVIQAFNELSDIAFALFLVPCCFPKKDKIVQKAKDLQMNSMDYWLQFLQQQIKTNNKNPTDDDQDRDDTVLLQCIQLPEMLSEKNYLIRCVNQYLHQQNNTQSNSNKKTNQSMEKNEQCEPPYKKQKTNDV